MLTNELVTNVSIPNSYFSATFASGETLPLSLSCPDFSVSDLVLSSCPVVSSPLLLLCATVLFVWCRCQSFRAPASPQERELYHADCCSSDAVLCVRVECESHSSHFILFLGSFSPCGFFSRVRAPLCSPPSRSRTWRPPLSSRSPASIPASIRTSPACW